MLGKRLVELRKKKGMTQEEVAKKIHLTRSTYAQYEVDRRVPEYATLQKLADFFEVSIDYIVGRTDIPNKVLSEGARKIIDSLDLSDEEIMKTVKLEVDGILLTPEQVLTFVNYVRVERATKKQVPVSNTDNI